MGIWDFIKDVSKTVKEARDSQTSETGQYRRVEFDQDTFQKVIQVIEHRAKVDGVIPRMTEPRHLDVVGESNYQEDLTTLAKNKPGSEAGWFSGFLLPEPMNEYDPNAVAVYIIDQTALELMVCKVGYLPRELAQQLSSILLEKIANQGDVVPILAGLNGGEPPECPAYGVNAQCFWDFKTAY
jgi:hypothetical protein